MLVAVFADVHANREAFEACLEHSQRLGASAQVFLGDLVGYGADPAWVVERVMEFAALGAVVIRGNHDEAITTPRAHMREDAAHAVAWTRAQLSPAQRDFLLPELRNLGFDIPVTPEGAFYIYANCERLTSDSYKFCWDVLETAGVAIAPGLDFGEHLASRHVRFSYPKSIPVLQEGVARLRRYLGK